MWNLNKTPNKLTLAAGEQTHTLSNTQTGNSLISFDSPLRTTTSFTLTAQDSKNKIATKTTLVQFLNGKYYGVSTVNTDGEINDAFIKGLTKQLTTGRTGSFTVTANAGQYIYFAIPATFGTPAFFVGGFEGGFNKVKTLNFTNASGHAESYNVYKTTNAGLGQTTVEVR